MANDPDIQVGGWEFNDVELKTIQPLIDRLDFRLRDLLLEDGRKVTIRIAAFEKKVVKKKKKHERQKQSADGRSD